MGLKCDKKKKKKAAEVIRKCVFQYYFYLDDYQLCLKIRTDSLDNMRRGSNVALI